MIHHKQLLLPVFAILVGPVLALAAGEPAMEKRIVAAADSAKQWSPAECTIESATGPTHSGQPVLHWHVTVDHFGGEPNYPIGWPRIGLGFKDAAARDWAGWDFLQMWIYSDTSRDALPHDPAGLSLHAPDRDRSFAHPLTELKKGQWVQVRIPLSQIPRHEDVRYIQFHISEANYRHQDKVDFYIDDLALLRYARPTLLDFSAENEVMFADGRQVPLRFELTGVKPNESVEVNCELRRGEKAVAKTGVKALRGAQRVVLDLGSAKLEAGEYQVVAHVSGGAEATAAVRLVESPWAGKVER